MKIFPKIPKIKVGLDVSFFALLLLLVLVTSHFITRPDMISGILFFLTIIYLYPYAPFKLNFKKLVFPAFVLYFIFQFFGLRLNSWDGLNLYYQNVLILLKRPYIYYDLSPRIPYLVEFLLTFTLKTLGINFMNLLFATVTVFTLYIIYYFFTLILTDKKISLFSTIFTGLSSSFLHFALREFKVEMFLLLFVFIGLIFVVKCVRNPSLLYGSLAALSLSLASLTKISFLPLAFVIFGYLFLSTFFKKNLFHLLIFCGIFVLPILIWASVWGLALPGVGNLHFYVDPILLNLKEATYLQRDPATFNQCLVQSWDRDYTAYYANRFPFIGYFFDPGKGSFMHIADMGFVLHFGMLVFPLLTFFGLKKYFTSSLDYYFVLVFYAITVLVFFLFVKTVYWYIIFLYPFFAMASVIFWDKFFVGGVKKFVEVLFFSFGAMNFLTVLITAIATYAFSFGDYKRQIFAMNDAVINLESVSTIINNRIRGTDFKVLNATEHPFLFFNTFIEDPDRRVVWSNFYFASSNKSLQEMRDELVSQNFKYILAYPRRFDHSWYKGCPRENMQILKEFLEKHAKLIKIGGFYDVLYEII